MITLLVGVAGGLGALLRFLTDGLIRHRLGTRFPYGIAVVNVSGSFLLGVISGVGAATLLPGPATVVVSAGVLGGYTTFSTASLDTVRLVQQGRRRAAVLNSFGLALACVLAAALGWMIGSG